MWSVAVFGVFLLVGFSLAQNPYALKRPSYCSTCFTNDQAQNYYCCFYFFRCCAESRLSSNNRKITTPSSQYPDLLHTTKQKTLTTGSPKTDESTTLDVESPCCDEDRVVLSETDRQDTGVLGSKTSQDVSPPDSPDSSRRRNGGRFGDPGAERTPSTSYSSAYGGRRYPYNVPRVYPVQQPSRGTDWRRPANRNGGVPGRSRISYGEAFKKDVDVVQRTGNTDRAENTGGILWGRMEPVEENSQGTQP